MIYASTTFFDDNTPISKALKKCEEYSIKNLELGSNHAYENNYIKAIEGYSFNFIVHNYFLRSKKDIIVNIASQNNDLLELSLKHIFKSIDFCKKINSNLFTFHPGFLTDPFAENQKNKNYDFQWNDKGLKSVNYKKSFETMINSIEKIIHYSSEKKVKISIETEGSYFKKDHLLLQCPEEFESFIKYFNYNDIKFNVNIGHLNLAAKAHKFNYMSLVNIIEKYINAFELSHNDGLEDQHLPLNREGWYWDIILDKRFLDCYKILECRNTEIEVIKENINLIKEKLGVF